jgi:hypothetical protein
VEDIHRCFGRISYTRILNSNENFHDKVCQVRYKYMLRYWQKYFHVRTYHICLLKKPWIASEKPNLYFYRKLPRIYDSNIKNIFNNAFTFMGLIFFMKTDVSKLKSSLPLKVGDAKRMPPASYLNIFRPFGLISMYLWSPNPITHNLKHSHYPLK